jgi:hypothetical protein
MASNSHGHKCELIRGTENIEGHDLISISYEDVITYILYTRCGPSLLIQKLTPPILRAAWQRFAAIDRALGILNTVLTTTTRSRNIAKSSSTAFIISLLSDEARRTKARRVSACQYSMAAS